MSSNSSTLILVGVGLAVLLGLLFFSGGDSQSSETTTTVITEDIGEEGETIVADRRTLTVDIGENLELGEREAVLLRAVVQGTAAGSVRYQWMAEGGLGFFSNPTSRETYYTAPSSCDCQEHVVITLTAIDGQGAAAVDSLYVSVRNLLGCSHDPCEEAMTCAAPEPICPAEPEDPCEEPAELCPVHEEPCDSPCVEVIPPEPPCDAAITPCPCVEGDCTTTWMGSWPYVPEERGLPADRPKPQIVRHFPAHIAEGSSFELRGTIRNPGCTSACFVWLASKGTLEGADTLSPTYRAPESDRPKGETVSISLIVYDGFGGRSYDQIRVAIDNRDYDGPPVP